MEVIDITLVDDFVILEMFGVFVVAEHRATAPSLADAEQICRQLQDERNGDDEGDNNAGSPRPRRRLP